MINYKLFPFTRNLQEGAETETITNLLNLLDTEFTICNIPQQSPSNILQDHSIVIAFGRVVELAVQQAINDKKLIDTQIIVLPKPSQLINCEVNKENRATAFTSIQEIKRLLKEERFYIDIREIKEDDLPNITASEVALLEKLTEEAGQEVIYQVSRGKQLIKIGKEYKEDKEIFITFEELYAVKLIMEVLKTDKVEIKKGK